MRILTGCFAVLSLAVVAIPADAQDQAGEPEPAPDPRAIVARGIAAHGGETWRDPRTLILSGRAVFFDPKTGAIRSRASEYRMWRKFERGRTVSHGADGKVRIRARNGDTVMFEVGYDGETTWTEKGIIPKAEADKFWANNFGFGIIRSALDDGFVLERAPARTIDGHSVELVRVIDPQGQKTLFGFDVESGHIRYMAFTSPRGFHERYYDDFVRFPDSGWVQARSVTLFYDGIKSNTIFWQDVAVGSMIDPVIFSSPHGPQEDER